MRSPHLVLPLHIADRTHGQVARFMPSEERVRLSHLLPYLKAHTAKALIASLAHLVEHLSEKQTVIGSIPIICIKVP